MRKSDEAKLLLEYGKMKVMQKDKLLERISWHDSNVERLNLEVQDFLFDTSDYTDEQKEVMRLLSWHYFCRDYGQGLLRKTPKLQRTKDMNAEYNEKRWGVVGKRIEAEKTMVMLGEEFASQSALDMLE